MSRWFEALVDDWATVYAWNPRLYRRVVVSGLVLGSVTTSLLGAIVYGVWMMASG